MPEKDAPTKDIPPEEDVTEQDAYSSDATKKDASSMRMYSSDATKKDAAKEDVSSSSSRTRSLGGGCDGGGHVLLRRDTGGRDRGRRGEVERVLLRRDGGEHVLLDATEEDMMKENASSSVIRHPMTGCMRMNNLK